MSCVLFCYLDYYSLKTQQNANWREVHTARSDAVNTMGRQNKA